MYKLNVTTHFSSAHKLNGYEGACKNLHGHNWKVRLGIKCYKVDDIGMTIDYGIVKKILNEIVNELDHQYLNDLPYFTKNNPTSENIAKYLYNQVKGEINSEYCKIAELEIWESDKTSMVYFEE